MESCVPVNSFPLHVSTKSKYCWFKIPKCASCTISDHLDMHTVRDDTSYRWGSMQYRSEYVDFFNFAFVRNPYERLVSCWADKVLNHRVWSHSNRQSDEIHFMIDNNFSFREFIFKIVDSFADTDGHWRPIIDFLPQNFAEFVFIGRLENFRKDFEYVCDEIGIVNKKYVHVHKTERKHYTTYYDDETCQLVAEKYAEDIEQFGYKFGD